MLFVKKAALRPVPKWAVVDDVAVGAVEQMLGDESDQLQDSLDAAYREMDRRQPALAKWLGGEVSGRSDDLAQSLGYFLIVTVYMAFREAFPTRLGEVSEAEVADARGTNPRRANRVRPGPGRRRRTRAGRGPSDR